jgi:hypothetical protein
MAKHREGDSDRPGKQMDVPKKVKKELGKVVKKAIETKKQGEEKK